MRFFRFSRKIIVLIGIMMGVFPLCLNAQYQPQTPKVAATIAEYYRRAAEYNQQIFDQMVEQVNYLTYFISDILAQDIDSPMRELMTKRYNEVQIVSKSLYENGPTSSMENMIRTLTNKINSDIVTYNNRVAKQKEDAIRKKREEDQRLEQEARKPQNWSGSGFALNDGYVVTNYHVVEDAKAIIIKGIKGDFGTSYTASIATYDKFNDLALLKINDTHFTGFGKIPYSVKTTTSEVGEDVFVLGYPLTATMGDEIKYSSGVISSKTGFQGDVSLYQISAPIQPGNSGGPLFDSKGNLIGVINAKHTGAENVGYAIKASYLRNLIESFTTTAIIPTANSVSSLSRTEQIKSIKKFVFLIECSSSQSSTSNSTYSSGSFSFKSGESFVNSSIIGDVKTVTNPQGGSVGGATITKVELSKSYTKVYIHYVNNYASGGWCSINPDTYIQGPSGNQFKLVKADNIPLSPNKHSFRFPGEALDFCLEFPALTYCHDIRCFKLVEPGDSPWKFYEIIVN